MTILIDTQSLVWIAIDSPRLSEPARAAITDGRETVCVSAVTAYEFVDLNDRGRFGADIPLDDLMDLLDAEVVDYPAAAWKTVAALPDLHRDPVDRMLIAHAIWSGMTLVTADATIRRYPVSTIW